MVCTTALQIEKANVFHVGCQRSNCYWKWSSHDASSVSTSHSLLAFWVTDIQNRELPIYFDGRILYHDRGCRWDKVQQWDPRYRGNVEFLFFYFFLLIIGLNAFFESPVLIATLDEHSSQVKQVGLLLMIGMATGCKSLNYVWLDECR